MNELGQAGLIGRFKPLHRGGKVLLETICKKADYVEIGIGSSNQYNMRNPFTAEETKEMIDALLSPNYKNYEIFEVPDLFNEPKWIKQAEKLYEDLDYFVSGNEYVFDLLKNSYNVIHPADIIPGDEHVRMRATEVRMQMARGGDWEQYVPDSVADYLKKNELVKRFRKEFGLETVAKLANEDYVSPETKAQERAHVFGGL